MKYNGKELIEMSLQTWDGNPREMLAWNCVNDTPVKTLIVEWYKNEHGHYIWRDDVCKYWNNCADIPNEDPVENKTEIIEKLKEENADLKSRIKELCVERGKMANAVSGAVWKELMDRVEDIAGPDRIGLNEISDIVLNKILQYKPEKKFRRMTYKELDDWLKQGKGVIRIANHVRNEISYDCEDRNHEVSGYYKICGYDEDTWHEPMVEE